MSRVCQITGKRTKSGCTYTRSGLSRKKGGGGQHITGKTKRVFKPNIQTRRVWVEEMKAYVRVKLSTRALKTIDRNGAYNVLLEAGLIKPIKSKKKSA